MKGLAIYHASLAVINWIAVLGFMFGDVKLLLYIAIFPTLVLFATFIGDINNPLRMIGAMFNFMGVVAGGLAGVEPVIYMALFGSIMMVTSFASEAFSGRRPPE
jgi:hypothetical protein